MDTPSSYDRVAAEYTARIAGELEHKPLDRELLDRFAALVAGRGPVADLGCGPGHVARYLHERGVAMVGIDLSVGMVAEARRLHPGIEFHRGDMRALDVPHGAWAGIVAFYAIIHVPRGEVVTTLREWRRTLKPDGWLLLAFHAGDEVRHVDEWRGEAVNLDFVFFRPDEMAAYLEEAGFAVVERVERDPYPEVEAQTPRAYMLARRADA